MSVTEQEKNTLVSILVQGKFSNSILVLEFEAMEDNAFLLLHKEGFLQVSFSVHRSPATKPTILLSDNTDPKVHIFYKETVSTNSNL